MDVDENCTESGFHSCGLVSSILNSSGILASSKDVGGQVWNYNLVPIWNIGITNTPGITIEKL